MYCIFYFLPLNMTSPSTNKIEKNDNEEPKQQDQNEERTVSSKANEEDKRDDDKDSNSGWGDVEEDVKQHDEQKIDDTHWDKNGSEWKVAKQKKVEIEETPEWDMQTDHKKTNDVCWPETNDKQNEKASVWSTKEENSEKQQDKQKEDTQEAPGWDTPGNKTSRQSNQTNDNGWGRSQGEFSRGYQSGFERPSYRHGRSNFERPSHDSYERNRRGERDMGEQRRDQYNDNDGFGRGDRYRRNDSYKGDRFGGFDGYRRRNDREDDNYRRDEGRNWELSRRDSYREPGAPPQYTRGNYHNEDRGFNGRNQHYNLRESGNYRDNNSFRGDDFGTIDTYNKRKPYYEQEKRPRHAEFNEGGPRDRSPSYPSIGEAPRRDFPDNEATRRFKKPRPINPPPSKVLGIFGMPIAATEQDVEDFILSNCSNAKINDIRLVKNHTTGLSKGFCFVYFNSIDESISAKEGLAGKILLGNEVRVDFSTSPEPRPRFAREE